MTQASTEWTRRGKARIACQLIALGTTAAAWVSVPYSMASGIGLGALCVQVAWFLDLILEIRFAND